MSNPQELDASQLDEVYGTGLGRHHGSFGQGAELDMINIQSLMSQRQMAVQFATDMIKKMNASASSILKNIGS